jgi:carboxyl-terminal processing protease
MAFVPPLPLGGDRSFLFNAACEGTPSGRQYGAAVLSAPRRARRPHADVPSMSLLRGVAAGVLSAALLTAGAPASTSANALPPPMLDGQHEVVDEVYELVRKYYVDPTFHGVDWDRAHDELMSTPLRSKNDTYKGVRALLARLGDVYTRLLEPAAMEGLRKYDVSGVGLLLTANARGELAVASEPLPTSSAGKAGVKRGDVLVSVEGVSLEGRGALKAAELMQGDDGTPMRVGIRSSASGTEGEVVLVRQFSGGGGARVVSSLETVRGRRVGYVKLADFSASSRGGVERALRDLDERGADAYVLDLRRNPGGVFEGALEIAGLFEGRSAVVARVTSRGGAEELFRSRIVGDAGGGDEGGDGGGVGGATVRDAAGKYENGAVVPLSAPVAVVVDGGSASSSEVLGGGLRDNCRAVIAGSGRSYGKGLIQGVFGLTDGGGVVVTVASYRTPSGAEIQGQGLVPAVGAADGPLDALVRLVRGQGAAAAVDFDRVEDALRLCRAAAGAGEARAQLPPAAPLGP